MSTSVQDRDQAAEPGLRRARTGYRWLLLVFLLAVAAQIFLAGLGVFGFGNGDRAGGDHAFSAHQGLGFALAGVSILLLVLAIAARAGLLIAASAGVQYALVRRR
jgi:hypothetical protein